MKIENDLGRDDIRRLVLRLAIPSMLAQFINVLYSVVDRIYIGNIPVIGETALAGVGVSGPIVTLISAFAYLVGLGGSPLMSIRMGEGQDEKAKKILANSFWMIVGLSAVLTLVLFVFKREILTRFGASEAILPYAESYFTIYLLGTVFALLSIGMNQFIICQGFARIGMISVALGAVTNIVLDPVFIFVFDMGVAGAAFATVLSQFASAVFVLRFLRGNRVLLRLEFECPQVKTACKIALMGLSPFLIIAFDNVLIISLNTVIQMYGGAEADMLLTCTTIVQSFMLIVTMPLGGITSGTGAILGFNFGAGRPDRIRSAQKYITLLAVVQCSIMFLFSRTLSQYFVYLFTRNESYVELTVWAIRVYTMGIIPLAVQYEVVDGFTGMGVPSLAISLSMFRKLLYLVSVFLIPVFAGVENVFYAEVVSDFGGTTVSVIVYLLLIGRIMGRCVERAKMNGKAVGADT
ncbi:MATE family efflux transporter [uncultured Clostridium sp.]|uniref:MATE family efflux transporter n=1 Tax=uncultured Clostridium sp. TaxID=59620 RepID=UPI0025FFB5A9|nr:MATE family efflux transporter [uncultured Clostridium sp.]